MSVPSFSSIKSIVSRKLPLLGKNIEFEVRIRNYNDNTSSESYRRILDIYNPTSISYTTRSGSSYNIYNVRIRGETIREHTDEHGKATWHMKSFVDIPDANDRQYQITYSLSTETRIQKPKKFKHNITRKITRSSIRINDSVRLDISEVFETDAYTKQTKHRYEFEAELLGTDLEEYFSTLPDIIKLVRDTEVIYPISDFTTQIGSTNLLLTGSDKANYFLDTRSLYKPRDLIPGDLQGHAFLDNKYNVSYKTDGLRKLLIWNNKGIWLLMDGRLNLIVENSNAISTGVYILDGELVPLENRRKYKDFKYYYVIFDVLVSDSKDVRMLQHTTRMTRHGNITSDLIFIEPKQFYSFRTPSDFWRTMRELEADRLLAPYFDDGYVFISEYMPYNSGVDKLLPKERVLTKYADMCKWKPVKLLTIDFEIRNINKEEYELYVGKSDKWLYGKLKLPLPKEFRNLKNSSIVEHRYEDGWIPVRNRPDRQHPNGYNEAKRVWRRIIDPIALNTLLGYGISTMRKYHNREKKILLDKYKGTLLDIGSGKGGDIRHWNKYTRVVAVEPNIDNVIEMYDRLNGAAHIISSESDIEFVLSSSDETYKILIYNGSAEDTDIIKNLVNIHAGGPVDVIASMFSLTFFWQGNSLQKLADTIINNLKEDGHFIYTVLDGPSVDDFFHNETGQLKRDDYILKFGGSVQRTPGLGSPLDIWIRGATVGSGDAPGKLQREYLVYIEDLLDLTELYKHDKWRLNREELLNEDERLLAGLYIAGDASRSLKPIMREPPEVDEDIELPELDISILEPNLTMPGSPTVENVVIYHDIRSGIIRKHLQTGTELIENKLVRIYTLLGIYNGVYDAILNAFYPPYATSLDMKMKSEISIELSANYETGPDVDKLSKDLNIGIVVVDFVEESKLSLYKYVRVNNRPVIIIGFGINNGIYFYETIGDTRTINNSEYFHTVFSHKDPVINMLATLPLSMEYTRSKHWRFNITHNMHKPKFSKKVRAKPSVVVPKDLEKSRDKFAQIEVTSRVNMINSRYGNLSDSVEDIIELINMYSLAHPNMQVYTTSFSDIFNRVDLINVDKEADLVISSILSDSLSKLKEHGNLIIKLDNITDLFSWSLIYYIRTIFNRIMIIKPETSLPILVEYYIVAEDFISLSDTELVEISNVSDNGFISISIMNKDKKFIEEMSIAINTLHTAELLSLNALLQQ